MSSPPRSVLIGRQVAQSTASDGEPRRVLPVLLTGILLGALLLAALRVDLIRLRYGLADVMSEEQALLEQRRELAAQGDPTGPWVVFERGWVLCLVEVWSGARKTTKSWWDPIGCGVVWRGGAKRRSLGREPSARGAVRRGQAWRRGRGWQA